MARDGGLSKWGVGSRSPAAWSASEIELQALATLAALAQISTLSAAHFLKSHQLLVRKFAADGDRSLHARDRALAKTDWRGLKLQVRCYAPGFKYSRQPLTY
jgi:hypothetical protein